MGLPGAVTGVIVMRQDILDFLIHHKDEFVSGRFPTSSVFPDAAVWKHIRALKQRGYVIESYTKKGYCLREAPELLSEKAILDGLQTKFVGRPVVYRERVDSTNNVAKKLADQGAPEGTIIVAEEQTGRARPHQSDLPLSLCQGRLVFPDPAARYFSHGSG